MDDPIVYMTIPPDPPEIQKRIEQWGEMVRSTAVVVEPTQVFLTDVTQWPLRAIVDIQKLVPCIIGTATSPDDKNLYLMFYGNQEEAEQAFVKIVDTLHGTYHLLKANIADMTNVSSDGVVLDNKISCKVTFRYEDPPIDEEKNII